MQGIGQTTRTLEPASFVAAATKGQFAPCDPPVGAQSVHLNESLCLRIVGSTCYQQTRVNTFSARCRQDLRLEGRDLNQAAFQIVECAHMDAGIRCDLVECSPLEETIISESFVSMASSVRRTSRERESLMTYFVHSLTKNGL